MAHKQIVRVRDLRVRPILYYHNWWYITYRSSNTLENSLNVILFYFLKNVISFKYYGDKSSFYDFYILRNLDSKDHGFNPKSAHFYVLTRFWSLLKTLLKLELVLSLSKHQICRFFYSKL